MRSSTSLELDSVRPMETGLTYYIFTQNSGDLRVYGSVVKLVTDKDGKVLGINGSILPGVKTEELDTWAISEKEAEAVVEKEISGVKIIPDTTEAVLLPGLMGSDRVYYTWVVYTNDMSDDAEAAYKAHYVSMTGKYLYSIPIQEPGDNASQQGVAAAFDFGSRKAG